MSRVGIVFDIGGTNTRVARVLGDTLAEVRKERTPSSPEDGVALVAHLADEAAAGASSTAVGCIAGVLDGGTVFRSPNLPGWDGFPLRDALARALGGSVDLRNDAVLVGLGEARYGAGIGSRIMGYVTVSTGVGGARIVDGLPDEATYGTEIGHQLVGGIELEALVSGTAVRRRYGIEPRELTDNAVRESLADTLAEALHDTVLHWSPDTLVLGGSMMVGENPIPLDRVRETLGRLLSIYPKDPAVLLASLGDRGGLWGGVALLRDRDFSTTRV